MITPVLALLNRSLRVEARSLWTYLLRLGLVAVICLILVGTWLSGMNSNAPGLSFFKSVMTINVILVIGVGITYFSSAITEEKEEMTMGLLIMTGLSPFSVLLGKSTSRMLALLLLLVAQFPFTLLSITLGGVSMDQVVTFYVTLISTAVFVGNLGLFCSVYCQRARGAAVMASLLFILLLLSPVLLMGISYLCVQMGWASPESALVAKLSWWRDGLLGASPFTRLVEIQISGFSGSPFELQAISNLIAGVVFFFLSFAIFNWRSREQKVASPSRGWVARNSFPIPFFTAGRPGRWAMVWKDFTFLVGGRSGMLLKFLCLALVGAAAYGLIYHFTLEGNPARFRVSQVYEGTAWFIFWTAIIGCALELSFNAGRIFKSELKWKTHSSLMTLPVGPGSIAVQKIVGCLMGIFPYLLYFGLAFIVSPDVGSDFGDFLVSEDGAGIAVLVMIFVGFVFFLYLNAFYSLILKWGAFPLSLLTVYMGSTCLWSVLVLPVAMIASTGVTPFFFDSIWPAFFVFLAINGLLIFLLHLGVSKKLVRAAGDGE